MANDGNSGDEIWRTLGTETTTELVVNLYSGVRGSRAGNLLPTASALLFTAEGRQPGESARTGLWSTDGNEDGTALVTEAGLATYFVGLAGSPATPIVAYRGDAVGVEPHALSGGSLALLADINDGTNGSLSGSRPTTADFGGVFLAFTAQRRVAPTMLDQIWLTNGSTIGRIALPDEPLFSRYANPINFEDALYFTVRPNATPSDNLPQEVWRLTVPGGMPERIGALPEGYRLQGWNAYNGGLLMNGLAGLNQPSELWGVGFATATAQENTPEASGLAVRIAPNPARGEAVLRFGLAESGPIRLAVVDALGREVAVLADGLRQPGGHEVRWDARRVPAGVYHARLSTPGGSAVQRLTVVR